MITEYTAAKHKGYTVSEQDLKFHQPHWSVQIYATHTWYMYEKKYIGCLKGNQAEETINIKKRYSRPRLMLHCITSKNTQSWIIYNK